MRWVVAAALTMSACACATVSAEEPRPERFAYAIEVRPSTEAPLYRVRLPLAVYRSATRTDLGDLRVFNAAGALVPHELWMPGDETSERRTLPLPVYALLEETSETLADIRVQIESGADRASIALTPGDSANSVSAYLVDRGPDEPPLPAERLVLHWSEPSEGFVRELVVEGSEDLASWSAHASAVAADLTRDGERLLRNEVELPSKLPRYLRIANRSGGALPMSLHRVDLVLSSRATRAEWLDVASIRPEDDGLHFEIPGPLRVEAIEVLPPERNTWAEVKLFSRPDAKGPWTSRGRGVLYRFESVADTRLDVDGTRDRFWRLSMDEARGGFGGGLPGLRVGYRPDDVVFVARGEGPFQIAFGSRGLEPPPRTSEPLRAIGSVAEGRLAPSTAVTLSGPRTLAGERALAEPILPDWRRLVLWGVLVSASLALLLIARAALSASA